MKHISPTKGFAVAMALMSTLMTGIGSIGIAAIQATTQSGEELQTKTAQATLRLASTDRVSTPADHDPIDTPTATEKTAKSTRTATSTSKAEDSSLYADDSGNPLDGAWRYEGAYYLFESGRIAAGGKQIGSKGRLYIPTAGIDVALNYCTPSEAQYYTDLEDSAAYATYARGAYYISDHSTQSFATLTQVSVGEVAYMITAEGIDAFVCTNTLAGHNTGSQITDASGRDLASSISDCGFAAYTCLSDWTNIQVTLWERTWIARTSSSDATVKLERSDATSLPMEQTERIEQPTRQERAPEAIGTTNNMPSPIVDTPIGLDEPHNQEIPDAPIPDGDASIPPNNMDGEPPFGPRRDDAPVQDGVLVE